MQFEKAKVPNGNILETPNQVLVDLELGFLFGRGPPLPAPHGNILLSHESAEGHGIIGFRRFAFIDEGLFSLRKFERFVLEHEKLFRALGCFTVVYVSDSQRNFTAAAKYLARRLPKYPDGLSGEDFPLGIEHFLDYLDVRDVFHNACRVLTQEGLDLLEEGERIYTTPVHGQLERDWSEDRITYEQISQQYARGQNSARFEGLLLAFKYPILEHRNSRKSAGDSVLMRTPPLPLATDE